MSDADFDDDADRDCTIRRATTALESLQGGVAREGVRIALLSIRTLRIFVSVVYHQEYTEYNSCSNLFTANAAAAIEQIALVSLDYPEY